MEASVSKVVGVSFNMWFGRLHCGEVGFCKAPSGNLVFVQVCCVSLSSVMKLEQKTIVTC
jgi:hypothetical protein